jgi:ABC-type transport system substrate-binding protein
MNPVIVPKEMLDENTLKNSTPIGTGPFIYKSHQQGSTEEVTRNPGYWVKDRPYMDGKKITFIPDSAAGEAAFRSGQTDQFGFTDIKQRDGVKADLGKKIVLQDYPSTSGLAMLVNIHRKPFDDPRVREALTRSINIQRIIDTVWFGDGDPAWYFSDARASRFPIGRKAVEQYAGYDPKKAAELLKAAGVDPNKEYELMAPVETQTWVDASKLISEDWAKVGLKTKVTPIVRNVYLQKAGPKPGDFDITMTVFLDYIYMAKESGTFWNNSSLEDPEVDAAVEKIRSTIDAEARKKLSNDVEMTLAKKYTPLIPVLSARGHSAWYDYVKGIDLEWSRTGVVGYNLDMWLDKA